MTKDEIKREIKIVESTIEMLENTRQKLVIDGCEYSYVLDQIQTEINDNEAKLSHLHLMLDGENQFSDKTSEEKKEVLIPSSQMIIDAINNEADKDLEQLELVYAHLSHAIKAVPFGYDGLVEEINKPRKKLGSEILRMISEKSV